VIAIFSPPNTHLLAIPLPGERKKEMTNDSPAPFFNEPPDIWVPIPNTSQGLPLTWEHTKAIRQLARFFGGLYARTQQSEEQSGLEKYKSWMVTLFQMTASIYDGKIHGLNFIVNAKNSSAATFLKKWLDS
jgi:hypothetical protein